MEEVLTCFLLLFLKMKLLFLDSLMIVFCISLAGAADDQIRLQRIETCHTKCSQGLDCRMKAGFLFRPPCQSPPEGWNSSPVFENISLSTGLRCTERQKCSLHLRIQTRLRLRDPVHGVSICTSSPGLISNCRVISFSKDSRERQSGSLVDVENDCTKISPGQEVRVTVETVPSFCETEWTGTFTAPGCTHRDLQTHVPDCITGKLSYKVNPERKYLTVNVTEMRQGHNYNLRLCLAKGFICAGTGPLQVIKKEDPVKSVTLSYTRPVPCLCIEGWSAVLDARRVQVCPFRQHVDELWTGITFDVFEASLSWQPLCPVTARVMLCQKQEDGDCIDLPHTSHNVTRHKVQFTGVESHPQLCMKFSVDSEDWIRCPFAEGRFPALEAGVSRHAEGVALFSPAPGTFSVGLCEVKSAAPPRSCQSRGNRTVIVETRASVDIPIPADVLQSKFCLQVKRLDMAYTVTAVHCFDSISQADPHVSINPTWIIVPVGVLLALIILTTLGLHIWVTVYQRRIQKKKTGSCPYEKQKDCVAGHVLSASPGGSAPLGEVLIPDSPQSGKNEKANLLHDPQA